MNDKKILIAIKNGIIGLDIRNQLNGHGYNAEIINPANEENIKNALKNGFQLMIIEKQIDYKCTSPVARLASEHNLPTIYLSTDHEMDREKSGFRSLMMPFGEEDLKDVVKSALGDK